MEDYKYFNNRFQHVLDETLRCSATKDGTSHVPDRTYTARYARASTYRIEIGPYIGMVRFRMQTAVRTSSTTACYTDFFDKNSTVLLSFV